MVAKDYIIKKEDIKQHNIDDYIRQELRAGYEKNNPLDRIIWNKEQWIMLSRYYYNNGFIPEYQTMIIKESKWWFKYRIVRWLIRDKIEEENQREYQRIDRLIESGEFLRNGERFMGVQHFKDFR